MEWLTHPAMWAFVSAFVVEVAPLVGTVILALFVVGYFLFERRVSALESRLLDLECIYLRIEQENRVIAAAMDSGPNFIDELRDAFRQMSNDTKDFGGQAGPCSSSKYVH